MKRNVSVVRFKFHCNILISGKIIEEMLGSVAMGHTVFKLFVVKLQAGSTHVDIIQYYSKR